MEPLTHYVPFWNRPDVNGKALTVCEILIPERETDALPTCPRCEAYWQVVLRENGIEARA